MRSLILREPGGQMLVDPSQRLRITRDPTAELQIGSRIPLHPSAKDSWIYVPAGSQGKNVGWIYNPIGSQGNKHGWICDSVGSHDIN